MSIEGIIVGLLAIAVGAGWATYGLKFFTIMLPIWAFFFGLLMGVQWGQDIFGQGFFGTITSWVIGGVFAIALALLSYFWYYAAVSIAVGAIGYALGVGLMDFLNIDASILGIIVGLIVGGIFLVAALATGFPAILIVIVSAIGGAATVVNGVLLIIGRIHLEDLSSGLVGGILTDTFIGIVAWIVLAALAFAYQLRDLGNTMASIDRSAYRY
jgi:hypothetical protein